MININVFNAKPRLTYKAFNGAEVQVLLYVYEYLLLLIILFYLFINDFRYPAASVKVIHSDPSQLVEVSVRLQQAWQTGEFGGR